MPILQPLVHRILSRLITAEAEEPDPSKRDDLRIARLIVAHAARGDAVLCSPQVLASYEVLGLHPEKVWPAVEARRHALLGPLFQSDAPPKKPAQSVKLWFEKTNAARTAILGGGESLLRDNTIGVPMATQSIAALYPNPEAPSSAKNRDYSLAELKVIVGYSGAPDSICALTISALRARGEWPHQDGPATTVLSIAIIGMMLEGVCCRSTVQRRIKRAMALGYWRRRRDANSWTDCPKCSAKRSAATCGGCGYRGRSKDASGKWTGEFMRVPEYEFDVHKFRTAQRCREIRHFDARSYAEYKAAARRGEHPNLAEMPARKPSQPEPQHRSPVKAEIKPAAPKLTRREAAKFVADLAEQMRGCTSHVEQYGGLSYALDPSDPRYRPKMPFVAALAAVCKRWGRAPEVVQESLKFWGYKFEES